MSHHRRLDAELDVLRDRLLGGEAEAALGLRFVIYSSLITYHP